MIGFDDAIHVMWYVLLLYVYVTRTLGYGFLQLVLSLNKRESQINVSMTRKINCHLGWV